MELINKYLLILLLIFGNSAAHSQIPKDGLLGYYKLEGNSKDASALELHGSIEGDVFPTTDRFGNAGKACEFEGGQINLGNPIEYQLTDSISISAWIKPTNNDVWMAIVSKWEDFDIGSFYLGINPEINKVKWNLDMAFSPTGTLIEYNEWRHIVATYDGSVARLFENGVQVSYVTSEDGISNVSADLLIGAQANYLGPDLNYKGAIDDVLIYSKALSPDEVVQIYEHDSTVSTTEELSESLELFPVPFDKSLNVKATNINLNHGEIINMAGKVVQEIHNINQPINTADWAKGIYIIRLYGKDGMTVSKKAIKI